MLCENDCIKFFEATEVEIRDHEDHCHWTLMLCTDLPVDVKRHGHMVFQMQEISQWNDEQTQGLIVRTRRSTNMGTGLLGYLHSCWYVG
jgi:hypothetical protein